MDSNSKTIQLKDSREQFKLIISISICAFIIVVSDYILNISLPTIAKEFHTTTSKVSWLLLSYMLVLCSTVLIFGRLSDRTGLRKLHIIGYCFFILGSIMCSLSPTLIMLIISRIVQGIGGSMLYVSCFSLVSKFLPVESLGWAFGIISTVISGGMVVGIPLGGFITGMLSWRYIFLLTILASCCGMAIASKVIPKENMPDFDLKDFDLSGSILWIICLSSLVFGSVEGIKASENMLYTIVAIFLTSTVLFVLQERKCSNPILDLELIKNNRFMIANMSTLTAMIFMGGHNFLFPFYLEQVKGLTTEKTSLFILIYSVVFVIISPFAGKMSGKIKPEFFCITGMLSALGSAVLLAMTIGAKLWWPLIVFIIWLAVSFALFISPNNNLVMQLGSSEKAGSASGIFSTISTLGIVLGVCLFEVVFSFSTTQTGLEGEVIKHSISKLQSGFYYAYLWGGLFLTFSMVFSFISLKLGRK